MTTVVLEAAAHQALKEAFGDVRERAMPVTVEPPKGASPFEGQDELLVLVLGARGGLAAKVVVHGREVNMRELGLRLAGAEAAVEQLAQEAAVASPIMTAADADLLDAVGLVEGDGGSDQVGPLERSRIEYELLLHQSPTLNKMAKRLDVDPSRLRQRLTQHTLYGIKDGRSWRIPTFQIDARRKKLVRGIDKVFPHVRADAHPLAVVSWFLNPHQDLVVGDHDTPVSPIRWLSAGESPDAIVDLAQEI